MLFEIKSGVSIMDILIVGATGSIGKNLPLNLSKKGHEVYGVGRKEYVLKEMVKKGYLKDSIIADLATEEGRNNVVEFSKRNSIECLIYSQGVIDSKPLDKTEEEKIKEVINTNLTSIILMDQKFLNKYNPKKIVYFGSVSSFFSWGEGGTAYQASKTGLEAYISTMRLQDKYTGRRIERIGIYPDTIKSEIGMSSELENFPKIPMEPFVEEVVNIIEGKYSGKDFLLIINDDEEISLEELLTDEKTNRPIYYKLKEIKKLGKTIR